MNPTKSATVGFAARTRLFTGLLIALALAPEAYSAGTFAPTSSLDVGRVNHTATLLANGKVLVVGGFVPSTHAGITTEARCELYDPATETWTPTGSLVSARARHTATLLLDGRVLVAGSRNRSSAMTAELYDPGTGRWTRTGDLISDRDGSHKATLLLNGKVLVIGGVDLSQASVRADAELYDPATGIWTATGSLQTPRHSFTSTLLPNGKVLVAGGYDASTVLHTAELYDPSTGKWTATGSLNVSRRLHAATLLPSGKVLIAGGRYNESWTGPFPPRLGTELYDPATETWTNTGSLNTGRGSPTATLLPNGKVLIVAGADTVPALTGAELYDPAADAWTPTGSLVIGRYDHTATLLPNGKVLIAAGRTSDSPTFTSAELFSDSEILPFSLSSGPVTALQRLPDGTFQFGFTNVSGFPFSAFATDDLSAPAAHWTFVGVGIESAPGQYQFTDPQAPSHPRRFYVVKSP